MSGEVRTGAAAAPQARPRIVFFGSGPFALALLDRLLADERTVPVAIVSTPDRPAGRDALPTATPVAARAREIGADLRQPATLRDDAAVAWLAALAPDLAIVADYGRIVPAALLAIPHRGFLNAHPSLLPRHRGATPVPATIAAGDTDTGVTIIAMDAGIDTGPVIGVVRRRLDGTETTPGLEAALAADGAALLAGTLGPWLAGAIVPVPQSEEGVTLTRPLRREDGRLDPALTTAVLERRVRAHLPWPGSFVEVDLGRLIVHEAAVGVAAVDVAADPEGEPARREALASADAAATADMAVARARSAAPPAPPPGRIVADGDGIALATSDGLLRLLRVQLGGGRPMSGAELRRGRPAIVGASVLVHVSDSASR